MRKPSHWAWILGAIAWVIMSCLLLMAGYYIGAGYVRMTIGAQAEYNATEISALESNLSALTDRLIALQMSMTFEGVASYYAHPFHGRTTASGTTYNMYELTAASKCLPFGSKWRVLRLDNGKSVVVEITDDGPNVQGRMIDLSYASALAIGMTQEGITRVRLTPAY